MTEPATKPKMALWKKLLIGLGVFFVAMVILGLLVGEDTAEDEGRGTFTEPTTSESETTEPATPLAPPPSTPALPAVPAGKTLATPESRCESAASATPLAIRSTTVSVGEIAGRAGTSAKVTITYDGQLPETGSVLWSLLANNPKGEQVQLGWKTVDGQRSAYFWFPFSQGQQHNMDGFADTSTPGEITMVMPQAALDALGDTWWWSSVLNVDGEDISTCGG